MKLTLLLLIVTFLGSMAAESYAQATKLTLDFKNSSVKEILNAIEDQSEFRFFYSGSVDVDKKTTISQKNKKIFEILDELFEGTDVKYEVIGRQIALVKGDETFGFTEVQPSPQKSVSGTVTDEAGEPLPGVTVIVKGTTNGTVTNADGNYSLTNIPENATLQFSFVGMRTQEIEVGNQSTIDVTMVVDAIGIEEVVAVGYGVVRKSDLTGAVNQLKAEDIENLPVVNVQQALQGQASGVKVRRNSGDPGGSFGVFIRGVNSASNTGQPLYVVDGVPLTTASLSNINPNEVATMDVLKDASATAIYGSRAANGVVIITTKTGKKGEETKVNFSSEVGLQTPILPYETADAFLNAEVYKEAFTDAGFTIPEELNDPVFLAENNNNWQELGTRNSLFQRYNLSVSGGSEKTQFLASVYYLNSEGVVIESGFENATLRLNLDHQASEKLKIGTRITAGYNSKDLVNIGDWSFFGSPVRRLAFVRPWVPHKNEEGVYPPVKRQGAFRGIAYNPIADLEELNREQIQFSTLGNVYLDYEILKNLNFKYSFGAEFYNSRLYDFDPIFDRGDYKRTTTNVTDNQSTQYNWVSDATLTYDAELSENHKITGLLGFSAQRFDYRFLDVWGTGATNNKLNEISGQPEVVANGGKTPNGLLSYFGRVFYSFKDRYLLTATVRRDGSSRFGEENKWGTFPSASLGWRMSDEPFMGNAGFVSNLKWRVSYGLTGNQEIPPFRYISTVGERNYAFGNGVAPGFAASNPANPFIQWESLKQFNAGLDFGFFDGRVSGSLDYYIKTSEDLLTNVSVSPTSGYTGTLTKNIGSVENEGFEVGLNTVNTTGVIKWTTSLNLALNKNEVIDLGLDDQGNAMELPGNELPGPYRTISNLTTQGQPIGAFYGWIWDGIYQLGDESEAAAVDSRLRPGDVRFRDLNDDGKITDEDRDFIGNPHPTFYGGITNNIGYKGFTLSIFADFATGHSILNTQRMFGESGNWNVLASADMANRWTPENPSTEYPRATNKTQWMNSRVSTNYVEKADFLRISNLTLAYDLPQAVTNRLKAQNLRVSLIGNNLFTFTSYRGNNPETSTGGNTSGELDPLTPGIDIGGYPLARMYSVKIDVTF